MKYIILIFVLLFNIDLNCMDDDFSSTYKDADGNAYYSYSNTLEDIPVQITLREPCDKDECQNCNCPGKNSIFTTKVSKFATNKSIMHQAKKIIETSQGIKISNSNFVLRKFRLGKTMHFLTINACLKALRKLKR